MIISTGNGTLPLRDCQGYEYSKMRVEVFYKKKAQHLLSFLLVKGRNRVLSLVLFVENFSILAIAV